MVIYSEVWIEITLAIEDTINREAGSLRTAIDEQLKKVSQLHEEFYQTYGLYRLTLEYFEVYSKTDEEYMQELIDVYLQLIDRSEVLYNIHYLCFSECNADGLSV